MTAYASLLDLLGLKIPHFISARINTNIVCRVCFLIFISNATVNMIMKKMSLGIVRDDCLNIWTGLDHWSINFATRL